MILEGTESLCCLQPDFADVFFTVAGQRLSSDLQTGFAWPMRQEESAADEPEVQSNNG